MNRNNWGAAELQAAITSLTKFLINQQKPDGTWRFCFENGTIIDAYMIILLRSIHYQDEAIIQRLHHRIIKDQHPNGYWSLYKDEEHGNLAASIDNYHALLYSGYSHKDDLHMQLAKKHIVSQGGMESSKGLLSKAILAATGQIPWPSSISSIPLEIMLLPSFAPVNLFEFSGYSRVHLIPMLIMAKANFSVPSPVDMEDLFTTTNRYIDEVVSNEFLQMQENIAYSRARLIGSTLQNIAKEKAVTFMVDRIEDDGTLYSYASSTILMIFALLSLGIDSKDARITKAINGLLAMRAFGSNYELTFQNSPSTIWDTALISYALQQAHVPYHHPSIRRANAYLVTKQHNKQADWSVHNKDTAPGGWGFSESNTINPDVDDTTAALRALYHINYMSENEASSSKLGLNWILSMQNQDGGWPAFEKNVDNPMLTWLALDGAKSAAIDPSTADLTGRTLEYLGNYTALNRMDKHIQRGIKWLLKNQASNGSWYGKWGICYIYGTWAALTGLQAVGVSSNHQAVQKATKWLLSIQNEDGGWGESCDSDRQMRYIPLQASTPSQTAWALDALIAVHDNATPEINRGTERLMALINSHSWASIYPTGAGLPGNFYVHYHSYRYIYPLLALSHYSRKYLT